jgi:hypothetical protein
MIFLALSPHDYCNIYMYEDALGILSHVSKNLREFLKQ